jgi:hypothetical protein
MSIITLNTRSLPDSAVTTAKLNDSAVTTAKINADAVTDAKIADDVIGTEHLTAGEVDATALASNAVTTAKIADSAVTKVKTSGVSSNPFRNIIINGDMSLAQRGTSATGKTSNGYYTVDRFQAVITSQGTWTHAQSTDVPTGQGFAKSLKIDCTTADASPGASDKLQLRQKIEGQNLQYLKKGTSSAESLTLSFWVRSNKTGTYIAEIFDTDNSRQISQSYTISSADTWEQKELTFAGDTTGALTNDNGDSFECVFWLGAGSNFTSGTLSTTWTSNTDANRAVGQVNLADSTSNEWYITGIQLEAGTSASDFEFLPHEINGFRCCRYYQHVGLDMPQYRFMPSISTNWSGSAQLGQLTINFPMRANPTTVTSGSWTGTGKDASDNNCVPGSLTSIAGGFSTMHRFSWNANQNSASLGIGAQYYTNGDTPDLAFDAEL